MALNVNTIQLFYTEMLATEFVSTLNAINIVIIHSKYFPVSDWLKPHA